MQSHAPAVQPSHSLDVLSPREVEARLSIDQSTIWRMRRRGEFPEPVRLSPGRVGYVRSDVEAWLETRRAR